MRRTVESGGPAAQAPPPSGRISSTFSAALARAAAGEPSTGRWVRPAPVDEAAPFHDWLTAQAARNDPVGDFAGDYSAGVRDSDHRIARTPDELLSILYDVSHSPEAYDAGVVHDREWINASPRRRRFAPNASAATRTKSQDRAPAQGR